MEKEAGADAELAFVKFGDKQVTKKVAAPKAPKVDADGNEIELTA
jgi:hypothetical protein